MKDILILAYQISPTKGSEYSVAWNYVTRMSKYNRLTVIYGVSGEHLGDCGEMKEYLKRNYFPNVKFICVSPNQKTNILNWCNRHNFFNYTFYWAYRSWQKQVYDEVKNLMENKHFDLIHFVGPIGYREPGYLWKLGIPYLWGPIGGSNKTNVILQKHTSLLAWFKFRLRNVMNEIQLRKNKRLKLALENTDLLLTATTENQKKIERILHKKSSYLPENAIAADISLNVEKFNTDKYHFVIIGSLIERKAVHILLESLIFVKHKDLLIIDIIGDGPTRSLLEEFSRKQNIDYIIRWHGHLSRIEAIKIFNSAHFHVITSLSEGNPTTIWEAMSHGVPTMSFDHCGMHDTICERCGVKIPIRSYEQCVSDLAKNIDYLLEHPEKFEQLAYGVLECAKKYTWDDRELFLQKCYDQAIENFKNRIV